MRKICCWMLWSLLVSLLMPEMAFAQTQHQTSTFVVNGQSGKTAVIQDNGRTYVDLEGLAHIANGSVTFNPNQIVLTIPPAAHQSAPALVETPKPVDESALSREFMKAGIEQIALLREWASPIGYAIQNGYPITDEVATNYRARAADGLRMASVAASTPADRKALELLNNEFEGVRQWSDQLVEASQSMNTAKYSMSPGSLRNEPQSQKLIACWHFLGSMLGSGSFQDDSSCH